LTSIDELIFFKMVIAPPTISGNGLLCSKSPMQRLIDGEYEVLILSLIWRTNILEYEYGYIYREYGYNLDGEVIQVCNTGLNQQSRFFRGCQRVNGHLAGVVAGYDKTGHPRNLEMVFPIIVAGCGKSGDFVESTQDQSFPWQDTTQKPCFGGEFTRILGAFQGLYTGDGIVLGS
jgi:hypothetical protein